LLCLLAAYGAEAEASYVAGFPVPLPLPPGPPLRLYLGRKG